MDACRSCQACQNCSFILCLQFNSSLTCRSINFAKLISRFMESWDSFPLSVPGDFLSTGFSRFSHYGVPPSVSLLFSPRQSGFVCVVVRGQTNLFHFSTLDVAQSKSQSAECQNINFWREKQKLVFFFASQVENLLNRAARQDKAGHNRRRRYHENKSFFTWVFS